MPPKRDQISTTSIDGLKRPSRRPRPPSQNAPQASPSRPQPAPRRASAPASALRHPGDGRARTIAQMSAPVAHKIRSAQVVLDPAAVIKELVENALDAGATKIDIRVRGKAALDSITVSDNGTGIAKHDYDSLCLAASTSKISDFADLDSLATFGFRGEALSAICAIAKSVSFLTRTADDVVATNLKFAPDGSVCSQKSAARPIGTTTYVEGIFNTLPVRRKDAIKNASREISRCVSVVQALALISVHTRIELKVASDIKVLSQPFNPEGLRPSSSYLNAPLSLRALRVTTRSVLGGKAAASLIEVSAAKLVAVDAGNLGMLGKQQSVSNDDKRVSEAKESKAYYGCSGLTSSAALDANGSGGRAKSSHQYVFANRRPVDFPRLVRAVNDLYRRATGLNGASPVIILNLDLPEGTHDVNISPDKRGLMIREEDALIAGLLEYLESVWTPKKVAPIPIQRLDFGCMPSAVLPGISAKTTTEAVPSSENVAIVPRDQLQTAGMNTPIADLDQNETRSTALTRAGLGGKDLGIMKEPEPLPTSTNQTGEDVNMKSSLNDNVPLCERREGFEDTNPQGSSNVSPVSIAERREPHGPGLGGSVPDLKPTLVQQRIAKSLLPAKRDIATFVARRAEVSTVPEKKLKHVSVGREASADFRGPRSEERVRQALSHDAEGHGPSVPERVQIRVDVPLHSSKRKARRRDFVSVKVDWDDVCNSPCSISRAEEAGEPGTGNLKSGGSLGEQFTRASFSDPTAVIEHTAKSLNDAELEMSRLFRQEWFKEMKVLGQFNKGFIVCRLRRDLFIIDQHASDEKYNFEDLQRNTVITRQKLVRPLALEFSAQDELIVLQHIDAFRAGGFGIEYKAKNRPTKRLYLHSQPVSKRTMFVQEDLQEMVAMLKATVLQSSSLSVQVLRPPRIRAMFASRACRKSVMIGTALKKGRMERIVGNLASIEHPWTCPHGRPTMRHLCTLQET